MNLRSRSPYKLAERPKVFRFKIILMRFRYHLVWPAFLFICLMFYAVNATTYSVFPANPNSNPNFQRLKECLTSAGVDGKNLIQRSNGTKYKQTNWQWNTVNGNVEPMAYLIANDVSDVQNAVICCQLLNIRLVPRSGGHSIVKNSFGDSNSLVIDLKRFNRVSPDPIQMSCEVGPGALAAFVTYTLWKEGEFMIPVGICPTVGLGGLALGGGYGYYTRIFGLTSDNLLELEMVDATGKLLLINNSTNEDLFWALRGGGGGSFGIVTKLKFRMYSCPKYVTYGIYKYNLDDLIQFYESLQSLITSDLPNNIGTVTRISSNTIEMEILKFDLQNNENVSESFDFESLLRSFSFPSPIASLTRIQSYQEFMITTAQYYSLARIDHFSQLANITRHGRVGMTKLKSFYVDVILDNDEISKLQVLLGEYLQFGGLHIEQNLGAINNFTCSETAFIHRGTNMYHIQLEVFSGENEEINLEAISAMNTFYEASKAILKHRQSYQNYLDEDIPDYLDRYYGDNLKKLIEVKMRVDPDNVFHHPQSIPAHFV